MAKQKTAPLDPKVADKLLDLLSTDNEFRRLFKKSPLAALAQAGHPEAKAALAAQSKGDPLPTSTALLIATCCQVQRIAPKEKIAKAREELKAMLTAGLAQNPPQLDVGIAARNVRK